MASLVDEIGLVEEVEKARVAARLVFGSDVEVSDGYRCRMSMQVDEKQTTHALEYGGCIYYFCSEGCRAEFHRHPEDYVKNIPEGQAEGVQNAGVLPGVWRSNLMENIKLTVTQHGFLAMALVMVIVLLAPAASFAQEHGGMGKQVGQGGMKMGQGAKKKAPMKSAGMSSKGGGMGMEDDMDEDMCCMKMMGSMSATPMAKKKGMGGMKMSSALPGFPGSSHLYHIGSTGFFLDHPTHITLTSDQQMTLNRIKERAMLDQSDADRKIEEADQQMWQLTAADSPDSNKIEAKAREIEKVRADQRLAFIRAVGEAAKVLTPEQQQVLLGTKPADVKKPMPSKMKM